MSKVSVIVIVRNEEKDIFDCLNSVKSFADEIVVVDSGSTDRTIDICREFTKKIFHLDWRGYGPQKQYALEKSEGPWVLNIDADERVSSSLRTEIKELVTRKSVAHGYQIPFIHYFLGKRLKFGSSWGEKHIRLFKKDSAYYGKDLIHEGIQVNPPIKKLRNPIEHHSYRDMNEYLTKCHEYTDLIAKKKYTEGQRFHFWHHMRLPYEFIVRYFIKLGILDGLMGLKYAAYSSYYVWLKYSKMRKFEVNA